MIRFLTSLNEFVKRNEVALLGRQAVLGGGGGGGEADAIRIGDAAGTGEEIAVTQDIWTLLRWSEQVFSPGRSVPRIWFFGAQAFLPA